MIIVSDCLTCKADEGTIKIASKLARLLKAQGARIFQLKNEVEFADCNYKVGKIGLSSELVRDIKKENGDVLYIPNASMTVGICVKVFLLRLLTGKKIILLPVYRREITPIMRFMLEHSGAELVVLSRESYDVYSSKVRNKVHYIKAGVDTTKFVPVDKEKKEKLREKYNFDKNDKIILHVGHMVEARNIRSFLKISDRFHIVILVSTSTRWDENLFNDLSQKENITIVHEYIENVEEYYQLADAYLFLVENIGCVDVPLSVLEAASCNIPIVTTRYGELAALEENNSFIFVDDFGNVDKYLDKAISADEIKNREMVLEYDWNNTVESIKKLFKGE